MKRLAESLLDDIDAVSDRIDAIPMIEKWLKDHRIYNYKITSKKEVHIKSRELNIYIDETSVPEYIKFANINRGGGQLSIFAPNLEDYSFMPKKMGVSLMLHRPKTLRGLTGVYNKIHIQEGAMKDLSSFEEGLYIKNSLYLYDLSITSLKGLPSEMSCRISISKCNQLTTLAGGVKIISNASFDLTNIKGLKDLTGIPQATSYSIYNCDITSLKGMPEKATSIYLADCKSLKSLEGLPSDIQNISIGGLKLKDLTGCPEEVEGYFSMSNMYELESLKGCPKKVGGNFYGTPRFTKSEVRAICDVKGRLEFLSEG